MIMAIITPSGGRLESIKRLSTAMMNHILMLT